MAYVYNKVNWEDLPSTNTPRNATNLGNMDTGIKENNNMLNGTKPIGSIVVEDINCKNMFNPSSVIVNAGVNNGVIFSTNDYDIYVVKVVPTKKYTISKTSYNGGLIGYYSTFPAIGNTITNMQTLRDVTTLTITAQDNYLCIMIAKADNIDTIQVEPGETVSAYTPYKDFDLTIKSKQISGTTSTYGNLSTGLNKNTTVVLCFHANNNVAIPTFYTNQASNEWTIHIVQTSDSRPLASTSVSGTLYYIDLTYLTTSSTRSLPLGENDGGEEETR